MEVDGMTAEGGLPSTLICCTPSSSNEGNNNNNNSSSSSSSSVDAMLQSLGCPYVWVHRGSGGRMRKAAGEAIKALEEEGAVCLAADMNTASRCISVGEIAKRQFAAKGDTIASQCFFAGLQADGPKRRDSLRLFLLLGRMQQQQQQKQKH